MYSSICYQYTITKDNFLHLNLGSSISAFMTALDLRHLTLVPVYDWLMVIPPNDESSLRSFKKSSINALNFPNVNRCHIITFELFHDYCYSLWWKYRHCGRINLLMTLNSDMEWTEASLVYKYVGLYMLSTPSVHPHGPQQQDLFH